MLHSLFPHHPYPLTTILFHLPIHPTILLLILSIPLLYAKHALHFISALTISTILHWPHPFAVTYAMSDLPSIPPPHTSVVTTVPEPPLTMS